MSAEYEFLTVGNLKQLLEIISDVFDKKYNISMTAFEHVNVKDVFLTVMQRVNDDPENAGMDLTQRNIITLRIVREILKTNISPATQMERAKSAMHRESDLHKNRHTVLFEPSQQARSNNPDVLARMEDIQNARREETTTVVPMWDDDKRIQDTSESEESFKSKIASLESARMNFDKELQNELPAQSSSKLLPHMEAEGSPRAVSEYRPPTSTLAPENDPLDFKRKLQDIFEDALDDHANHDFIERRNESMSSILNKNPEDVDPTAFFKQNAQINDYLHTQEPVYTDPSSYKDLAMSTIIKKQDFHESRIEKKYILINSYDRNWIVDRRRYQYKVRFSYSSNEVMRVPYYENNPTVPFTKTEKTAGIRNDFGWVDTNGVFHEKYDPTLPLSSITDTDGKMVELGFEEVEIVVDQDASMVGTFKNIHSIQVTNVSIPTEIFNSYVSEGGVNPIQLEGTQYYNYNFNFPYILCNIEEFQDVYDGTDDIIRKTFCQLQLENFIKTPNGRGYVILKPVQNEKKIFYPNPLANLPTLNISLLKPNGELLNNTEDGLSIFTVSLIQNFYLKVVVKEYFDKNAFYHGDYVRIRNFNIYQINSDIDKAHVDIMNTFINRPEGHVVFETGDANESGYYNAFHIFAPGHFDKTIGRFVVNTDLTDTLTKFNNHMIENNFFDETNNMSSSFENGFLINMSLQNSVSITVEMFKPEAIV